MYGLNDFVGTELQQGERVHWSGQPALAAIFSKGDLVLVPASLLWSAMALSFAVPMLLALRDDADALPFAVFFAVPFGVMAFYAIIGRLLFRLWVKSRTHYLVTDERVLALSRLFGTNVQATFLDDIGPLKSVGSTRSTETIWFGDAPWWMIFLGSSLLDSPLPLPGGPGPVVFYDVREAARVRELVADLRVR